MISVSLVRRHSGWRETNEKMCRLVIEYLGFARGLEESKDDGRLNEKRSKSVGLGCKQGIMRKNNETKQENQILTSRLIHPQNMNQYWSGT
mmetsp:Transcript_12346/g.25192  ORF Transcript_12346/g.25192 Transcript_12346/m.25192 type:complete len:91 (-) Transcript_12346:160-432(-)